MALPGELTWAEGRKSNMNYNVFVTLRDHTIKFVYVYSCVSDRYLGLTVDAFTDNIYWFMLEVPWLFEELSHSGDDYREVFNRLGMVKRDFTTLEALITR